MRKGARAGDDLALDDYVIVQGAIQRPNARPYRESGRAPRIVTAQDGVELFVWAPQR